MAVDATRSMAERWLLRLRQLRQERQSHGRHDESDDPVSEKHNVPAGKMTEEQAFNLVMQAIDSIGGPQNVYRNPRMAFAFNAVRNIDVDGHSVEIRYGEISTPAIATLEGWVFEIHDQEIELLMKPVKRHEAQG